MGRNTMQSAITVASFLVLVAFLQQQSLTSQGANERACRTFLETGKTVCGRFLVFWQQHGGLPIFGYPISSPFTEKSALDSKSYTVQYFERAVFELHPENQPPYNVLPAQLGAFRFSSKYSGKDPGEPNEHNLPLYPNVVNVKVTIIDAASPDEAVINVTTFETEDSPQAVIDFYKEIFKKTGWELYEQRGANYITYVYVSPGPGYGGPGPVYGLSVEATSANHVTNVTLRLYKTLPK